MEVAENEIRFIDLFSGIGGFRLGLERAGGYRCVWSNDFNKYANQVYTKNFGETNHHSGDIKGVDPKTIPDFDLLCAGFPCQSFSVAGKGKGFQDTRGTLFFEISRIAEAKRPQMLLLENVKGLLSNDRGQTFKTILQEMGRIGYWTEWQIFNSKHHGVPQNRERVFIIGHLRKGSPAPVFPITETTGFLDGRVSGQQTASALQSPGHASGNYRGMNMIVSRIPLKFMLRNQRNWLKNEAYTIDSVNTGGVIVADRSRHLNKKGRNLESPKLFTNALSSVAKDNYLLKDARIRRLTPVECERLQGFSDRWTEYGIDNGKQVKISDTQRYKMLGNAVTVNVIDFLGKMIKGSLYGVDPHSWSIRKLAQCNGQSEPKGTHNDADATNGASPCPTDLSSYHEEGT